MKSIRTFSTQGVQTRHSVDAWREYMSTVYYQLDIVPGRRDCLRGELREAQLEAVGVSSFNADAQRVVRYKEAVKIDGSETFVFLFPTQQPLQYEQLGRVGCVSPGEVVMLSSAEDYAVTVPDDSGNITLKIPCDVLRSRIRRIDERCARSHVANPALVPVVREFGKQLLHLQSGTSSLRLQDAVLDLTAIMLELDDPSSSLELSRPPLTELTHERLIGYIARHFREPELDAEQAAAALRVSVRYVHKIFHEHGTTFGRELLEARLREAHRLLSRPPATGRLLIGQIAYACGFSSQAHFSARYRERFGVTPRDTTKA